MLLLAVLSLVPVVPITTALQISSCVIYETYITTQYRFTPLEFSDSWFSHSLHVSPRKISKVGIRSKRLYGCCDLGYTYVGFPSYSCRPVCYGGCQMDAHCTAPSQCTCDHGYYKDPDSGHCLSNETLSSGKLLETSTTGAVLTGTTSTTKIPCNGSCPLNEICSQPNDICICANGFQRATDTSNSTCVPKCDDECQNADCTAPNTCTCWPHYEKTNDSSTCHLKCTEISCTFGECNENGVCICAEGFYNNGTNCLWAGDDIFSEPDYCKCWSRFIWQKNLTESRCLNSCEDDDISSDCIPFKECEFYEGYTICHAQMYKCNDLSSDSSSTTIPEIAEEVKADIASSKTSTVVILSILGLTSLLLVVVASLWTWNNRRNWLNRLWNYNPMDNIQENEQPNSCACYYGYEISDLDGTCKRIVVETKTVFPTVEVATFKVEPTTWQHIFEKSTHLKDVFDSNKKAVSEVTSEKNTKFDVPTMGQINFPRVKFVTYSDFGLGTIHPTSNPRPNLKIESSTNQIDFESSLETGTDFSRVKFIPHRESLPNNIKSRQTNNFEVQSYVSANCSYGICICQMGYQLIDNKFCTQCRIGNQCQCPAGYAYDSFRCKPLCNGVFDGCIQGTCVEHDECSCFNGTEKFTDDKFRCYVKETSKLDQRKIDTKWYLLVLLIPVIIVIISFYFVIKRSRSAKSNRLKAQRHQFQEIRYFHTNNNFCVQKMCNTAVDGSGLDGPTNQLNENILIVKVCDTISIQTIIANRLASYFIRNTIHHMRLVAFATCFYKCHMHGGTGSDELRMRRIKLDFLVKKLSSKMKVLWKILLFFVFQTMTTTTHGLKPYCEETELYTVQESYYRFQDRRVSQKGYFPWQTTYRWIVQKVPAIQIVRKTRTRTKCCPGFSMTDQSKCVPYCSVKCINAKCTEPGVCTCNKGFQKILFNPNSCEPICDGGCGQGTCIAPGKCDCFRGYQIAENNRCSPICDSGCKFGKCIAPNKCECETGYILNALTNTCEPICIGGCLNGHCSTPGECVCSQGFEKDGLNNCSPVCEDKCVNGECVAPNKCLCDKGYRINAEGHCDPVCENGCESGVCTAPDECSCNEGFVLNGKNHCSPICDGGCINGKCIVPNECACDLGYELKNQILCEPVCENGCQNGICVAPNICNCSVGHTSDTNNNCVPVCANGCPFGKCIAPNVCECQPGYTLSTNGSGCEPKCSEGCSNGFCYRPEMCVCNQGFLMGPDNKCDPVCSDGCLNGVCSEPEICRCLDGFQMPADSINKCEPICEPKCQNSDCVGPGLCLCRQGYTPFNSSACLPHCEKSCLNGYCASPNNCSCMEGYEAHDYEPNVCTPVCENCNYGDCISPGQCLCWPGYEMDQNSATCILPISSTSIISTEFTSKKEYETTSSSFSTSEMVTASAVTISSSVFEEISTHLSTATAKMSTENSFEERIFDLCNCWSLINSNKTNCLTEADIERDGCHIEKVVLKLNCNGTEYLCSRVLGNTSLVVRNEDWWHWIPVTAILIVTLTGIGLFIRKYWLPGNSETNEEGNQEFSVQYVSNGMYNESKKELD
ncbi:uncharacterized protein LOC129947320 [Eupeodes corollae]|uniref:uncharacterized protein LOC129947320 n=1 Tax=Eupeodes corollae TaxID=290404 RepID=UPI0024919BB5|nr:uncharacterized protein LOC129947320 [Eupeodes corollae]